MYSPSWSALKSTLTVFISLLLSECSSPPLDSPNSTSTSTSTSSSTSSGSKTQRVLCGSALYSQGDDAWGEVLWDSLGVHTEGAVLGTGAGRGAAGDLGLGLELGRTARRCQQQERQHQQQPQGRRREQLPPQRPPRHLPRPGLQHAGPVSLSLLSFHAVKAYVQN